LGENKENLGKSCARENFNLLLEGEGKGVGKEGHWIGLGKTGTEIGCWLKKVTRSQKKSVANAARLWQKTKSKVNGVSLSGKLERVHESRPEDALDL